MKTGAPGHLGASDHSMSTLIDLSGTTALITGASRGIGAAIARTLHQAGACVFLNHPDLPDGSTRGEAMALADALGALRPDSARVIAADVADPAAVEAMMESIRAEAGGLDFLINNAGILRDRTT